MRYDITKFGARLHEARIKRDMTAVELSNKTGLAYKFGEKKR